MFWRPATRPRVLTGIWLLAIVACRPAHSPRPATLTDADRSAIRALDTAFVQAWLRDDTTAVLRLFDPEAVVIPPNNPAVGGIGAIKAYWWPADGSHTRITSFTREVAEIEGTPGLAYLRGVASLGWNYRKGDTEISQTSRSTDLVVVAPDSNGQWRIIRQIWNQLPP
jgi:ketosteroid isomerase-like protein